jgi:hypothetical protein
VELVRVEQRVLDEFDNNLSGALAQAGLLALSERDRPR